MKTEYRDALVNSAEFEDGVVVFFPFTAISTAIIPMRFIVHKDK